MKNEPSSDGRITLSRDKYEAAYEQVSRREEMTDDLEIDFFSRLVPSDRSYRVLDLGCAEGKLSIKLAGKGHNVVASDIATGYLEQVKKNASSQSVNVETVRCDVEKDLAQLAGREFDYIFFMDVIEHLRSPLTGLENIRHLLSDNGWLFIHTPNACSVWRIYALIMNRARTCRVLDASQVKDLHLQLYDLQSLSQLCNFAGLEVTRILPTRLVVPILGNSRFLAKRLPALGDTLLLECRKCPPIDVKEVVDHWLCSLDSERTSAVKS